jgi:hypothetical protein
MKQTSIGLRIDPTLKTALEKAARDDARTVSSLAVKILSDWLKDKDRQLANQNHDPFAAIGHIAPVSHERE